MPMPTSSLLSSPSGVSSERHRGSVNQVDYDWLCGAAGADRGDGFVFAYAHAGRATWAAGVGGSSDSIFGGRDDRGRVYDAACRLAVWQSWRGAAWMLLVVGSVASLAANVAVAEPSATGG